VFRKFATKILSERGDFKK